MTARGELRRAQGTVRFFDIEEGWGVIDSEATPGGCWVHFSAVMVEGLRSLDAGESVEFRYREVGQDGYRFRAEEAWPARDEPVRTEPRADGSGSISVLRPESGGDA